MRFEKNTVMKKRIILLGTLLLLASACDDFLDLQPVSNLGTNSYFNSTKDVQAAVVAAYDGLQQSAQVEYVLAEIRSDNSTTVLGEGEFEMIDKFRESTTNSVISNYWSSCYNTILRANTVLLHLDKVTDESLKKQFEGEAKFIRGLLYFNLVRLFGEVPLLDKGIKFDDFESFKRKSVEDVYALIQSDLNTAAANLPASFPSKDAGRATSGAAKTLLAKVHMTRKNWPAAKTLIEQVITDNKYALLPAYGDVFSAAGEMNKEIIFAIRFKSLSNGEGQTMSYEFTTKGRYGGLNNPTSDLMSLYAPEDKRKAVSITGTNPALVNKYTTADPPNDAGNDWPVLRYADVMLMHAEILNELDGPTQAAADRLNSVRMRASVPLYTLAEIETKEEMAALIDKERRLELVFENHRWFDLMRSGKAIEVINAHAANHNLNFTIQQHNLLFPIPQREIDTSQGAMTQNPGYN